MHWKLALGVLRKGLPEPRDRIIYQPVGIDGKTVDLFRVGANPGYFVLTDSGGTISYGGNSTKYYLACADAFANSNGASVDKVKAVKSGESYFIANNLVAIEVESAPKPKRAKGKRL